MTVARHALGASKRKEDSERMRMFVPGVLMIVVMVRKARTSRPVAAGGEYCPSNAFASGVPLSGSQVSLSFVVCLLLLSC